MLTDMGSKVLGLSMDESLVCILKVFYWYKILKNIKNEVVVPRV